MKRFGGWEPATVYEHDAAGRLIRSVPETEWDAEQQGWMLALGLYRAGRCPVCGGDIEECGPASRGTWEVPPPRRCYRADAIALAQDDRKRTPRPHALMWKVRKKPPT